MQGLATFLPWFAKIAPKLSGYEKVLKDVPLILSFLKKPIDHHLNTFIDGQLRDFLDVYIQESKSTTDKSSSFHSSKNGMNFLKSRLKSF